MRIEVWCDRERVRPFRQPRQVGVFECEFAPREGDCIYIDEDGSGHYVSSATLNLSSNRVGITVPWFDPEELT